MSGYLDPWVRKPEGAKGTARALLWLIDASVLSATADDVANRGWCTLSQPKLADALGVSRRTAQRALEDLETANLIESEDRTTRKGTWQRRRPHPRLEAEWCAANPTKLGAKRAKPWTEPTKQIVVTEVMPWDDADCPAQPDTQTTGEDENAKSTQQVCLVDLDACTPCVG